MISVIQMNNLRQYVMILFEWVSFWLKCILRRILDAFPVVNNWISSSAVTDRALCQTESEEWKTNEALRTYLLGDGDETKVTVQTSPHAFLVSIKQRVRFPVILVNRRLSKKLGLIIYFKGEPTKTFRVQWVLPSFVPVQHERDLWEPHPHGSRVLFNLPQSTWVFLQ